MSTQVERNNMKAMSRETVFKHFMKLSIEDQLMFRDAVNSYTHGVEVMPELESPAFQIGDLVQDNLESHDV